jgi:hypothetical protein
MNRKVKQQIFLKYLWLAITKTVDIRSFIWPVSGYGLRRPDPNPTNKGPDPTGCGSATLVAMHYHADTDLQP